MAWCAAGKTVQIPLSILEASVRSDESEFVRQPALEALVRGWKNNPDTFPILKASAQVDKSAAVRQTAMQALARSGRTAGRRST
jgi:HEAT repeat protein